MSSFTRPDRSSFRFGLLRNIQEHASGQEHDKQTRAAVADEWQWNAFSRNHTEHDGEIDKRLTENHCGNAEREETAKTVRRGKCGTQATPCVDREKPDDNSRTDEAEFFAYYSVNKIGMRFGEIEKLLFA